MKHSLYKLLAVLSILIIGSAGSCRKPVDPPKTNVVQLKFNLKQLWESSEFIYNDVQYTNAAGNKVTFSNLKYLISGVELVKTDNSVISFKNQYGFINCQTGKDTFSISGVPAGDYKSIRFYIGVDSVTNHGDPNQYAVSHPLNPNVNQMFWGWSGGYVFMLLEGDVVDSLGANKGFSYHIANDENYAQINLPAVFTVASTSLTADMTFNVAEVFKNPYIHNFWRESLSTHSSNDGGLSNRIRDNYKDAFSITAIR